MCSENTPTPSRTLSRRGCLKALGYGILGVGAGGLLGYGYTFHIEPEWLSVERLNVPIKGLTSNFDGLRLVCLSDFHFEPYTQLDFIERVVERVNQLEPDLVCLLGDYVFTHAESINALAPVIARLTAKQGVYATLGNHDLWTNAETVKSGLEQQGIPVLFNQSVALDVGNDSLILAGLDDAWSGEPDLQAALAGAPQETPVILMLHEPDFADEMAQDARIALQLSGHSHGGQVRLPFYGAPFLPRFARKYDQGLYLVGNMWLYVTRGVGVIGPPGRFSCRPEITEITLVPPSSGA